MATLSGVWVLNSTLERPTADIIQLVNFTSNGSNATRMTVKSSTSYALLHYMIINNIATYGTSWVDEAYRTVDFGTDEQTVSDEFYTWFTANASNGAAENPEPVKQYLILEDSLKHIADGFRSSRGTTQKYTLDEMAVLAAEKTSGGGPMFASNASGRIPEYEKGTALSVLSYSDFGFESSAVGALQEE